MGMGGVGYRRVDDDAMRRRKCGARGKKEEGAVGGEELCWRGVSGEMELLTQAPVMMFTPGCVSMSATLPPAAPEPSSQAANGEEEEAERRWMQTVWGGSKETCG